MSLFDKLEMRATGMRGVSDFERGVHVTTQCMPTGEVRLDTLDSNEEYVIRTVIGVRFWANKAQLPEARRIAERQLAHVLFADLLGLVSELQSAISDGKRDAAMRAACRIRSIIMDGREGEQ